jgi:CheY-like chemotaxis protein
VLLSDDDSDFHELARDAFASARLRVDLHRVGSGEACLEFLRTHSPFTVVPRPDLLLLDMTMPHADAQEVMAQIRSDPALRTLPTVVCSAAVKDEEVVRMYDLGCNSFIVKPATLGGLRRAMEQLARYWFEVAVLPER